MPFTCLIASALNREQKPNSRRNTAAGRRQREQRRGRMWLWWRPLPPATFTYNPSNSREKKALPPPPSSSSSPPPLPPPISTTAPLPCSRTLLYKPGTDVCRGRAERPRCSGCQPHAFHSEMKAHSSPSCEANFPKKRGGRKKKKRWKKNKLSKCLHVPWKAMHT